MWPGAHSGGLSPGRPCPGVKSWPWREAGLWGVSRAQVHFRLDQVAQVGGALVACWMSGRSGRPWTYPTCSLVFPNSLLIHSGTHSHCLIWTLLTATALDFLNLHNHVDVMLSFAFFPQWITYCCIGFVCFLSILFMRFILILLVLAHSLSLLYSIPFSEYICRDFILLEN